MAIEPRRAPRVTRPRALWPHRCACIAALASLSACASTGAVPSPFPRPGGSSSPASTRPVDPETLSIDPISGRSPVAETALSMRGVPYRSGGADPSGFDCSGLVAYSFATHGVWVPRKVAEQFASGDSVDSAALRPGDLVFFETTGRGPSHVGIVTSGGEFVHAPNASGVVRIEQLGAPYWASRYLGARRLH